MNISKEELVKKIEETRQELDHSIDCQDTYELIYQTSLELDGLIEQYIEAGY